MGRLVITVAEASSAAVWQALNAFGARLHGSSVERQDTPSQDAFSATFCLSHPVLGDLALQSKWKTHRNTVHTIDTEILPRLERQRAAWAALPDDERDGPAGKAIRTSIKGLETTLAQYRSSEASLFEGV